MQSTTNVQVEAPAASAPVFQRPSGSGGGNKKGTSAERRATHNAIERARRESLNGRFLQLAASIPAISDVRRPSKSLIVNKSLDFVADAMNREAMYRLKIDNMRQENLQLRQQLNKFLAQAGLEQLPPPPVDELPVPMAEMGNKKRQASLAGSAGLTDLYDLDDDDGPFAAGSEGEGGKTSPTSSCSAASSMRGSLSSSLPSGVPGFTPIVNGNAYGQPTTFLTAPANLAGTNGTSPGASSGSEDIGRERSGGFEDASGNWIQASAFNGQALVSRPVGSAPAAASTQPLTYASLAFSSPDGSNGLMAQAPSSRPDMNGVQQMATSLPLRLDGAPNAGTPNVSGLPTVLAQNGQHQMFAMNANNYLQLRNAQQLQQHQQQQLQYQLQLQQHQQQQHQQQIANLAPFNSSSFFEFAPLQSASFMTAA